MYMGWVQSGEWFSGRMPLWCFQPTFFLALFPVILYWFEGPCQRDCPSHAIKACSLPQLSLCEYKIEWEVGLTHPCHMSLAIHPHYHRTVEPKQNKTKKKCLFEGNLCFWLTAINNCLVHWVSTCDIQTWCASFRNKTAIICKTLFDCKLCLYGSNWASFTVQYIQTSFHPTSDGFSNTTTKQINNLFYCVDYPVLLS